LLEEDFRCQSDLRPPGSREFIMNAQAMVRISLSLVNTVSFGHYRRFEGSAKDLVAMRHAPTAAKIALEPCFCQNAISKVGMVRNPQAALIN
jgi:hypothetical protein